jgi:hypothetical protein
MKRLCTCGHNRTSHKYLYCYKILQKRSPCKLCGKIEEPLEQFSGAYVICVSNKCNYYRAMTNLEFLEMKALDKSR